AQHHSSPLLLFVITLPPPRPTLFPYTTLFRSLAMGADRGVLLQTAGLQPDGLETAKALAAELKNGAFDLILFGKMAIDDYNHQVDRKSTRLNSSHSQISYAVFCLKKKNHAVQA